MSDIVSYGFCGLLLSMRDEVWYSIVRVITGDEENVTAIYKSVF